MVSEKIFVRIILKCTVILIIVAGLLRAEPFEKITLSLNGILNTNQNKYHNYWEKARGIEFQCETPFYLGLAESGVQIAVNNAKSDNQPDYWSAFIFIGWGIDKNLTAGLSWYNGFRIGNYYMNFDDNDIYPTLKSESELGIEFKSSIRYSFKNNISLMLSGRYRTVYTGRRIYHSFISIGIGKTFSTPRWLKEFLD